ncbi:MAG: glycerophosphodiester phosphodiesterase [Solirubrobacteraceae bacterium]
MRRVGHKGADLIAPGNTIPSFDAALAAGVDMIEFDVLPERGSGRLVLAHDYVAARRGEPPSLEEGLSHFASEAFDGVELDVDLKLPGYEEAVVNALRRHGLAGRALVSSQYLDSLAQVRRLEPSLRLGWSVPRARRDYTGSALTALPALGLLRAYRLMLPRLAARAIRARRCDALMAHWRVISPRLVSAVRGAGGELFAWTVDELPRIRALEALGVTGVITNDPRLFAALV